MLGSGPNALQRKAAEAGTQQTTRTRILNSACQLSPVIEPADSKAEWSRSVHQVVSRTRTVKVVNFHIILHGGDRR